MYSLTACNIYVWLSRFILFAYRSGASMICCFFRSVVLLASPRYTPPLLGQVCVTVNSVIFSLLRFRYFSRFSFKFLLYYVWYLFFSFSSDSYVHLVPG